MTDRAQLYRLLRDAARAFGLKSPIRHTAEALIRHIPKDATRPVSPLRVCDLAADRACDVRTIRYHIRQLVDLGLATNECGAAGRRSIRRVSGRIIAIEGIDFSPLTERRAEIEGKAALREAEIAEHAALRAEISRARRRFRELARGLNDDHPALSIFAAMPSQLAPLDLPEVAALRERMRQLLIFVSPIETEDDAAPSAEPEASSEKVAAANLWTLAGDRKFPPDRSERNLRSHLPKESRESVNTPVAWLIESLPDDWRDELDDAGQESEIALTAIARCHAARRGISIAIWEESLARLGRLETVRLTLAAEAPGIRCPAAWMRAMSARADRGRLDLSRNLLARKHGHPSPDQERKDGCVHFSA